MATHVGCLSHEHETSTAPNKIEKITQTKILNWNLYYDPDSEFLYQVTTPTGLTELAIYNPNGHQFPENAGLPPLPYVTQYTQYTKDGAKIIREYEYTDLNFLGYGAEEGNKDDWDGDSDYLYNVLTDYLYGSTEIYIDGDNKRSITRRYNNYHLLVSETIVQKGCKREQQIDYYAQKRRSFTEQCPQFQMPKMAAVRFNDIDVEMLQTEFDEAGNPTVQVDSDGIRTEWIYYPAEGEDGACPADPYGFVRYVKSKTVIPAKASPEGFYKDAPIQEVIYRYAQLPTRINTSTSYSVVCVYQGRYSSGLLLDETQTHYVSDINSVDYGRIHSIDETLYTVQGEESMGNAWTRKQIFSYNVNNEALITHLQLTGHDQISLSSYKVQSCFSGKLWQETDAQGRTTQYIYDDLGRILKCINNPNTDYVSEETYAYAIEDNGFLTSTKTDMWGNQRRTRFDGMGRSCQQEILGRVDVFWREVERHDNLVSLFSPKNPDNELSCQKLCYPIPYGIS